MKIPLLTHGVNTNYPLWKEVMRGELPIEYGLLASILDTGELLYPAEVDPDDYDLDDDPHGISKLRLNTDESPTRSNADR